MNDNERKYLESRIRSLDKAIKTYGQRISEHQEKLKAYKNNPEATDNKGFLKTAASEDARRKIIQGRIKHINQEIRTFKENIKKAQLEKRNLEKKMRELGKNQFQNETNSPSKNNNNESKKRLAIKHRYSSQAESLKPSEAKPKLKETSRNPKRKI